MSNHDAIGFYENENSFDCSPREGLSGRAKVDQVQGSRECVHYKCLLVKQLGEVTEWLSD